MRFSLQSQIEFNSSLGMRLSSYDIVTGKRMFNSNVFCVNIILCIHNIVAIHEVDKCVGCICAHVRNHCEKGNVKSIYVLISKLK